VLTVQSRKHILITRTAKWSSKC